MGSPRVRRPELDTIPIAGGDTITVKRYLTAGEFRALIGAAMKPITVDAGSGHASGADVAFEIHPAESAIAIVLAYLIDWTFTDFDGRPLVIRDQPVAVVRAALDMIDSDTYMDVQRAIQNHDSTMRAYLAAEKKTRLGSPTPAPISGSVV